MRREEDNVMNIVPWKNQKRGIDRPARELAPFSQLRNEIDGLFESFFREPWMSRAGMLQGLQEWAPSMDVAETEKDVCIKLEVPGIDPKDLDISISGHTLSIQGEKSAESEEQKKDYYHTERSFGSFRRVIDLPDTVDAESVTAEQKNGILTITLQKTKAENSKRIQVTAAKD
jgi:HSP20 family protein